MTPVKNAKHKDESRALLLEQFKNKPVIQAFLDGFSKVTQEAENAVFSLISSQTLKEANLSQLDLLGALVGAKRLGKTDNSFRSEIYLRIRTNRSKGRATDILDVLSLIRAINPGSSTRYIEYPLLSFELSMTAIAEEAYVTQALQRTRAATSYGLVTVSDALSCLTWDDSFYSEGVIETFGDSSSGAGLLVCSSYSLG